MVDIMARAKMKLSIAGNVHILSTGALLTFVVVGCHSNDPTITCSAYYRETGVLQPGQSPDDPALQLVGESVTLVPNEEASLDLGELEFKFLFNSSDHEGRAFHLSAHTETGYIFQSLYQFDSRKLPKNQFVGEHGFTGLIYLTHPEHGGDYQVICVSSKQ